MSKQASAPALSPAVLPGFDCDPRDPFFAPLLQICLFFFALGENVFPLSPPPTLLRQSAGTRAEEQTARFFGFLEKHSAVKSTYLPDRFGSCAAYQRAAARRDGTVVSRERTQKKGKKKKQKPDLQSPPCSSHYCLLAPSTDCK